MAEFKHPRFSTPFHYLLWTRLLLLPLLLGAMPQRAYGLMELGLNVNTRTSFIDKDNYQESFSLGTSIAYYFAQMSALELSYTQGKTDLNYLVTPTQKALITTDFKIIGLDLVFTIGSREDLLQPYIKFGAARIEKRIRTISDGFGVGKNDSLKGTVPSAGVGIKVSLSKAFSIKLGVEAWTSPLDDDNKNETYDYSGRAGVSWMF